MPRLRLIPPLLVAALSFQIALLPRHVVSTSADTTDGSDTTFAGSSDTTGVTYGKPGAGPDPLRYSCFRNSTYCCFPGSMEEWNASFKVPLGFSPQREPRCAFDEETGSYPCAVKLGVNNWLNSFANVHVAKIFIEEFLGYPVEIAADYAEFEEGNERTLVPLLEMWEWLKQGWIDAILEVWEIGKQQQMLKYINKENVIVQAGSLGVIGGIGWYIPSFLMQDSADDSQIHILGCESREFLEYWRSFESEGAADLFKNPLAEMPCCLSDTTDSRQEKPCMAAADIGGTPVEFGGLRSSAECDANPNRKVPTYGGRFLEGSSTWKVWEQQIIRNLGLNFTIEYAVTEQEILRQVELATSGGYGLLFYFWEPHAPFTRYNFTRINLPRRSEKCVNEDRIEEYDCDYPQEILFKMYRSELRTSKPDLADFFEAFRFASNRDQERILSQVYYNHEKFPEASCAWVRDNPTTWGDWTRDIQKKYNNSHWLNSPKMEIVDCKCSASGTRRFYRRPLQVEEGDGQVELELDQRACSAPTYSTYRHRWKNETIPTKRVAEVNCDYVVADSSKAQLIYSISSITVVVLAFTIWLVLFNRDKPHIRASNPETTIVFTFGALVMNLFPIISIGEATAARCALSFSSFLFGFVWFEGSLITKAYVLYLIFTPTKRLTKPMKSLLCLEPYLFFLLSSLVTTVWAVVVGFEPVDVTIVIPNTKLDYIGQRCPSDTVFETILFVCAGVMVVISCLWAFWTWTISPAFSEAKQMLVSCVNIVVFGIATLTIVNSMQTLSQGDALLIKACAIAITTIISVGMTVWTRLYAEHAGWTFDRARVIEESLRQRGRGHKASLSVIEKPLEDSHGRSATLLPTANTRELLPAEASTLQSTSATPLTNVLQAEKTNMTVADESEISFISDTGRARRRSGSVVETKGESEQEEIHTVSIT